MAPNGFLSLCVNGRYVARDVAGQRAEEIRVSRLGSIIARTV